ncbi:CBO0543 family protein [Dendrosporobacter sp. 1207_IL3150]|uniref:CBO0543 family protein n=1 Tax=Dendrosporobacter sp. 1207_IL3150 TaxID=3084054 RepID=UPI002FD8B8EA
MFYYIRFTIVVICFILFTDKKRWRELLPVSLLASCLAGFTDIITFYYPLWRYLGEHPLLIALLDNIGIYPVVTYLFIQWLPKEQTLPRMLRYWLYWTTFAISIEYIHIHMKKMQYGLWWHMGWSYLADWVLFTIFYSYHKILKLSKLSNTRG